MSDLQNGICFGILIMLGLLYLRWFGMLFFARFLGASPISGEDSEFFRRLILPFHLIPAVILGFAAIVRLKGGL